MTRRHEVLRIILCVLIVVCLDAVTIKAADARTPAQEYSHRVAIAPVQSDWQGPLTIYTGSSYGTRLVNQLWPHAPGGHQRWIVFAASVRYHVPLRLMLGVWGAESGFGRAACHFGLTGYFPGRGTSGVFWRDAFLAAALMDRLYRSQYHHPAVT